MYGSDTESWHRVSPGGNASRCASTEVHLNVSEGTARVPSKLRRMSSLWTMREGAAFDWRQSEWNRGKKPPLFTETAFGITWGD